MLSQLTEARDKVQTELAGAEIVLLEATANAGALREEARRLEAAVAVLSGEPPAAAPISVVAQEVEQLSDTQQVDGSPPSRTTMQELSPEEFDAERKRTQRQRDKERKAEELANNPLAHIKCSGCGRTGTMQDTVMQAPSGATVRMMVCYKCNNQVMT